MNRGGRAVFRGVAAALFVTLAIARAPSSALAAGSERAAAIFRQGQEAFAHKNYAAAAASFEQAAQLAPHPSAWLDAAEAWELDGAPARAAEDCDRALALPDVAADHRHDAEARLARLVPKIATLDLRSTRAQLVKVDGAGEVRAPGSLRIAPGRHELAVVDVASAPARTIAVDARAGATTRVELDPAPSAPPSRGASAPLAPVPPAASAPTHSGPPTATWVAFGIGAAAAGAGLVVGAMTVSAKSDFTSTPTIASRDRFYRARTVTNVAWGVAGAAAVVGIVLWITTPRAQASASVTMGVRDGGPFLAHETRF